MSDFNQGNRVGGFLVSGDDAGLNLSRLSGEEKLGRNYLFHVELWSTDFEISFTDLVGKPASVWLDSDLGGGRQFHGIISKFRLVGPDRSGNARYSAELRPPLWLLSRAASCRIFQERAVPDIIEEFLAGHGVDYELRLEGEHRIWNYCVQYRETDFNFLSRLMEQEGIYYFFEHSDEGVKLILADGLNSHSPVSGAEEISYGIQGAAADATERIFTWDVGRSLRSGAYVLTEFDFTEPGADLLCETPGPLETDFADYEVFDYPGEFTARGEGEAYSEIRLQELQADYEVAVATSDARVICPGILFGLANHEREDQNKEHLVTEARYMLRMPDSGGSRGGSEGEYSVTFKAIDSSRPFRSARTTPKPAIHGPQTAIVVGPSGEEIYTDEHGRVKLHFHWDRDGTRDENASCWVRVSQGWAGPSWGSFHIPRIDQEVIVEFLEGDPDRPIVTGRVYNGDNRFPYTLPDEKTKSGLKSRSTKEGTADHFNELRFEDMKGSEEVYFHAEKDMNRVVENNETLSVGQDGADKGDREVTIWHDELINVGNNREIVIGVDRAEPGDYTVQVQNDRNFSVGSNEEYVVGANRSDKVGKNEAVEIGENRELSVGKDQTVAIGSNQTTEISKDHTVSVGANESVSIGSDQSTDIGGSHTLKVGAASTINAGTDLTVEAGKNITIKAGMKLAIDAPAGIEIKCGSSSICINPSQVKIKAPMMMLQADGMMDLLAPMLKTKGDALKKDQGGICMIN